MQTAQFAAMISILPTAAYSTARVDVSWPIFPNNAPRIHHEQSQLFVAAAASFCLKVIYSQLFIILQFNHACGATITSWKRLQKRIFLHVVRIAGQSTTKIKSQCSTLTPNSTFLRLINVIHNITYCITTLSEVNSEVNSSPTYLIYQFFSFPPGSRKKKESFEKKIVQKAQEVSPPALPALL